MPSTGKMKPVTEHLILSILAKFTWEEKEAEDREKSSKFNCSVCHRKDSKSEGRENSMYLSYTLEYGSWLIKLGSYTCSDLEECKLCLVRVFFYMSSETCCLQLT